ncbi:MAG: DMT family transporter [Oscillospiraceae bacterium]|nr:DMT family transporter [Oscillospiraceae bacterium]
MTFLAYLFTFLKNMVYGSSVFFTSHLSQNVDVLDILALRFLMSFVVMWLLKVTKVLKIKVGVKDLFKKNERSPYLSSLILAGLFEPVLYMFFETTGISMCTGITTAVILSLSPISGCLCEVLILKERATPVQMILLGVGIVGVMYIAFNTQAADGKDTPLGILFIVLAVLCGSLFIAFSRKSSKHFNAMEITYTSVVLGTIAFNTVNVVRHLINGNILNYFEPFFSAQNMIGFAFLAVLSTIVATGMNNFAASKLQISTMAAFGGVSTFTTIFIGAVFENEKIMTFHIIGFSLIFIRMFGVSAINIMRDRKKNKAQAAAAEQKAIEPDSVKL